MWWDPDELGEWAFHKAIEESLESKFCEISNKTKKYKNIILNIEDDLIRSKWCYRYCYTIQDDEEMWQSIKHPYWAREYYSHINKRYEIAICFKTVYFSDYDKYIISSQYRELEKVRNIFEDINIPKRID